MSPSKEEITQARQLLSKARSLCILTGAGISAESGLKTFREGGGLWENYPVQQVATPEGFEQDPKRVWRFYNARRKTADVATPNPAHLALARLEMGLKRRRRMKTTGSLVGAMTILTQNIDGLHQQAGSQNVVELHGSVWKVRCTGCGAVSTDFPIQLPILPACEACDSLLRPHVVWFGESLEEEVLEMADAAIRACDVFLVVGTSAVVQPAASYPLVAARRRAPVIEVNLESTAVSLIATVSLLGKAGELLPQIIPD